MTTKALLLSKDDDHGNGLRAIRELEDELVDITAYQELMADNQSWFIIKDDIVYKIVKTYFDMDKGYVVCICKEDVQPFNVLPEETPTVVEGGGADPANTPGPNPPFPMP